MPFGRAQNARPSWKRNQNVATAGRLRDGLRQQGSARARAFFRGFPPLLPNTGFAVATLCRPWRDSGHEGSLGVRGGGCKLVDVFGKQDGLRMPPGSPSRLPRSSGQVRASRRYKKGRKADPSTAFAKARKLDLPSTFARRGGLGMTTGDSCGSCAHAASERDFVDARKLPITV